MKSKVGNKHRRSFNLSEEACLILDLVTFEEGNPSEVVDKLIIDNLLGKVLNMPYVCDLINKISGNKTESDPSAAVTAGANGSNEEGIPQPVQENHMIKEGGWHDNDIS